MKQALQKAVFPVAGLGTRFLPATKASPKEMLPVVDKPLIQYAVEEAYSAGVRHMIFVTGRSKRAIEDHFDTAYELENELEAAHKNELLALVRSVQPDDMVCAYVRQPRSLGLGHAVLCAEHLVGREPFAVLLAADLMVGQPSITAQMVQQFAASSQYLGGARRALRPNPSLWHRQWRRNHCPIDPTLGHCRKARARRCAQHLGSGRALHFDAAYF